MTHTEELIARLRDTASRGVSSWGDLQQEAADELETLMKAVTAEREACADVCDTYETASLSVGSKNTALVFKDCSARIRARGQA